MEPSYLCYIGPYRTYLSTRGTNISEGIMYALTQGFHFEFDYIHKHQKVRVPVDESDWISIVGSNNDFKSKVENYLNITIKSIDHEQLYNVLSRLEKDKSLVIDLDVYYLPYHPQYLKIHGKTNVLIGNYNPITQRAQIWDTHVPTIPISTYQGELHLDEIQLALIGKKGYSLSYINDNNKLSLNTVIEAIISNAKNYIVEEDYMGVGAIKKLAEEMKDWTNHWSETAIKDVYRQAFLHVKNHGGTLVSRKIYAQLLKEICKSDDLQKASELMAISTERWQVFSAACFRNSVYYSSKNSVKAIDMLYQIHELEKESMLICSRL